MLRFFLLSLAAFPFFGFFTKPLLFASLSGGSGPLGLGLTKLFGSFPLLLSIFLASPLQYLGLGLLKVTQHPRKTGLGLKVKLMLLFGILDARLLKSFKSQTIVFLLLFIVLGKEGSLLLPVRSFDVIQPLADDAHPFSRFSFILLELFDMHSHECIGANISESLK
jgi:hypothetical protein